ncbi:MAG: hypothetical protein DHS20C18_51460 [Saprospiraceae bacterium]|nr:MAG: hypothetical protein DHS20C18_51460 [Saprospiraceae bacterium]
MNLHKNKSDFESAIIATSQNLGVREVYIEKDYWVTYALKRLANSKYRDIAIFKGGTALSKALHLIERFSEDIDLALMIPEGATGNQIKKLIGEIQKTAAGDIPEIQVDGITSKGSKFRKTVHQYDKVIGGSNYGQASDKLLIEINSFANPNPHSLQKIQSYIGKYLLESKRVDLVKIYELEEFEINVLQLERTYTEKVLGLIRASYHEHPIEELKKKIRHIYDLERISGKTEIKEFLNSSAFFDRIDEVKDDDSRNHEFSGNWIEEPLLSSILFKDVEKVWKKLESTYQNDFAPLVYGTLPDSNEITGVLKAISSRLKEYDEDRRHK